MNALAVCRFDPANPTATATWALAGWNESFLVSGILVNTGKPILNGPGGTPIGRMCSLFEVVGAQPYGPSISAPVFDSKGNIWFLTAAELYRTGFPSDFDTVLVRGVYNPANFSYDLELVLQQGDTFLGGNSNRNYRITFLELAYTSTTAPNGNFSPGSLGAGSATQAAWNNMNPSGLSQTDSRTLGGLVLQAKIVYDVGTGTGADGPDGLFDDPSGTASSFPQSRDEAYRAVMYIGADIPPCLADFNHDNVVDFFDYLDFVDALSAMDPSADFNGDMVIDFFDYLDFVDAFSTGC